MWRELKLWLMIFQSQVYLAAINLTGFPREAVILYATTVSRDWSINLTERLTVCNVSRTAQSQMIVLDAPLLSTMGIKL